LERMIFRERRPRYLGGAVTLCRGILRADSVDARYGIDGAILARRIAQLCHQVGGQLFKPVIRGLMAVNCWGGLADSCKCLQREKSLESATNPCRLPARLDSITTARRRRHLPSFPLERSILLRYSFSRILRLRPATSRGSLRPVDPPQHDDKAAAADVTRVRYASPMPIWSSWAPQFQKSDMQTARRYRAYTTTPKLSNQGPRLPARPGTTSLRWKWIVRV
jgi:hypothetical protein